MDIFDKQDYSGAKWVLFASGGFQKRNIRPENRSCLRSERDVVHLPISELRNVVRGFNQIADDSNWNRFRDLPWESHRPDLLTEGQKGAVAFVTIVEDHLPGYFQEYQKLFPIETAPNQEEAIHNRELFHFTVRWGLEEDRHAQSLALYQINSGIEPSEEALEVQLIQENLKDFSIGFSDPVQVFTYTLLQEKATQMYYQSMAKGVTEPVLLKLLSFLSKDEARHYAFFAQMVETFIRTFGEDILPQIEEVVFNYKMPLHNTMKDYRRRAIKMAREAPGYDRNAPQSVLVSLLEKLAQKENIPAAPAVLKMAQKIRERLNLKITYAS